jgi:hypothetical protein
MNVFPQWNQSSSFSGVCEQNKSFANESWTAKNTDSHSNQGCRIFLGPNTPNWE